MAPRGAPSPGRRRPPISPAPWPACPARLRRGALRGVCRTRGPAWRPPGIGPHLPLRRRPQDDGEPPFSLCRERRAGAGPRRDPSLAKGARASEPPASASRSPGLAPDCHLLRLLPRSTATAPAGPSAALSADEWALSRGAQIWCPTQRSAGRRVRRGGPRAGERRGEGEGTGGEDGRGRSVAGHRAASTAAAPPPSPPLAQRAPPPPRASPPPWGSLAGTTVSRLERSPAPHSLWLEVLPPKLSLAASPSPTRETAVRPAALSADPRP